MDSSKNDIPYEIRMSPRARHIRLSVSRDARVILTVPRRASLALARAFLTQKMAWVRKALAKAKPKLGQRSLPHLSRREYLLHKETARTLVLARLGYWNQFYHFSYKRVAIRMTRSRWGSCSHKGNLNFSYRLVYLPTHLADYIIVHELCHLAEHNHGAKFWQLVAETHPAWKEIKKQLRLFV